MKKKTEIQFRVWGGSLYKKGVQLRVIVRAKTKKRALELLKAINPNFSSGYFNTHWSETRNTLELSVALSEGVWSRPDRHDISPQFTRES